MAHEPEVAAATPAKIEIAELQKANAALELTNAVYGKLKSDDSKLFFKDALDTLIDAEDAQSLERALLMLQTQIFHARIAREIDLVERNALNSGFQALAKECGIELKGITEER